MLVAINMVADMPQGTGVLTGLGEHRYGDIRIPFLYVLRQGNGVYGIKAAEKDYGHAPVRWSTIRLILGA